jgi:hypothetical protein
MAHIAAVGRGCHGVVNMERFWIPLLARHFGDVALPVSSFEIW